MRAIVMFGVLGIVGLSGCASVSEGVTSMQPETATTVSSVEVGPPRLLDAHVNPMAGVGVAQDGNTLVVRFAHPRGLGTTERLDSSSLHVISHRAEPFAGTLSEANRQRVVLDGSRFVVLWKSGDAEHGYRAMAQAFNASDGSPRGMAVAISPSDADVSGPLSAATSDGHHIVATFAASRNRSFAAYAVPIEAL